MPSARTNGATIAERYRLVEKLAEGGMGEVWIGEHLVTSRRVALKFLKEGLGEDARRRVIAEARAACAVAHPAIVPVHDVIQDDAGEPALVMDLLEGETLEARLAGASKMEVGEAAALLLPIADALAAAHAKGLVHRDLKPANIFLTRAGESKLLDFGIVKSVDEMADGPRTTTGRVMGTPLYMSPEQAFGEGDLDARTDVWSLGLILYQAITGELPTRGENLGQVLRKLVSIEVEPARTLEPSVPADIEVAVAAALARERDARAITMERLADVLATHATEGPDSSARRTRGGAPPARSSRRTRTASVALAETQGASARGSAPPSAPIAATLAAVGRRPESPSRPARNRRTVLLIGGVAVAVGAGVLGFRLAWMRGSPAPGVSTAASSVAVDDPDAPQSMVARPPPPSESKEAVVAYRASLSSYRDGAYGRAVEEMSKAIAHDADLGAAHLRLAIWQSFADPAARDHWVNARRLRETLSAVDGGLLDAIGPLYTGPTSDFVSAAKSVEALSAQRPGDAEVTFYAGLFMLNVDSARADVLLTRAVRLDPGFATAEGTRAWNTGYIDHRDVADALLACADRFPEASLCLVNASFVLSAEGRCVDLEAAARRCVRASPNEATAYALLAASLVATGAPTNAVEEVLRQKKSASMQQDNQRLSVGATALDLDDRIGLALVRGDFVEAGTNVAALTRETEARHDEAARAMVSRRIVEIALETGDDARAAAEGERWMQTRAGLQPDSMSDDWGIARDATPLMIRARRRGGLSLADARAARDAWAKDWSARVFPAYVRWIWPSGYPSLVETPEDAAEAIAAIDAAGIPWFRPGTFMDGEIGHVFLLAGKLDEARRYLERATRGCWFFDAPIAHTHAWLWLGQLREALHDSKGACEAYGVVLSTWGNAKPKSVTADEAAERSRALACGR